MTNFKQYRITKRLLISLMLVLIMITGCLLAVRNQELNTLIPASGALFAGIIGLSFIITAQTIQIPYRGILSSHLLLLACLFFYSLLSSVFSDNQILSVQRVISTFSLIFIITLLVFSDRQISCTYRKIAYIFSIFGCIAAIYSLLLKTFGEIEYFSTGTFNTVQLLGVTLTQKIFGAGSLRYASFFGNPNAFGLWLIFSLTNTYYVIRLRSKRNLILWFLVLIQWIALLNTGSRAAIVGAIIALLVFWTYETKKIWRTFLFWLGGGLILLLSPFIIRIISNLRGVNEGLSDRDIAWNILLQNIADKPILGEGFGLSFESILIPAGVDFGAHNIYLSLLSEIGVVGFSLFFFFWFWGLALLFLRLPKIKNGEYRSRMVSASAIHLGLSFNQFFENSLMGFTFTTVVGIYYLSIIMRGLHDKKF